MKKILEADVLRDCRIVLDIYKLRGLIDWFRITTTGKPVSNKNYARNSDQAGFSDLVIWVINGPNLYVELKSPTGKLSENQLLFKERAFRAGRRYEVVRSAEEMKKILEEVTQCKVFSV